MNLFSMNLFHYDTKPFIFGIKSERFVGYVWGIVVESCVSWVTCFNVPQSPVGQIGRGNCVEGNRVTL